MKSIATGTAKAPATCGELIQGNITGMDFLVTCPVNIFSEVTVCLNDSGQVTGSPNLYKVQKAVTQTLGFFNMQHLGAAIKISSQIPCGKGMASSSADISAACAAVAAALGTAITPEEISEIALSIEPTDGLMFPGIVLYDHLKGKQNRFLGAVPGIELMIVDLGGAVDTLSFNRDQKLGFFNRNKEKNVLQALLKMETALQHQDISLFGEAATESAFAHQAILPKPQLHTLFDICKGAGGIGINIAHSGTVVGLLFKAGHMPVDQLKDTLEHKGFKYLCKTELINGGIQVLQERDGERTWVPLTTSMAETCGKRQKSMI